MNREKVEKARAWGETINTGIRDDEPGAFIVRCVLNVLDQLIEAFLADEPKPDYYDDGTPGEYDCGVNPAEDYIPDDDPLRVCPVCGGDGGGHDSIPPCMQCGGSGEVPVDDPVDHTRTTNPDGTRTPTDEKLVPVGEGPITSPFTSDHNPDSVSRICPHCHGDGGGGPQCPYCDGTGEVPETEEKPTMPDKVTEAMRYPPDMSENDLIVKWETLAAAVRELSWFTNQTPYPYWRHAEESNRADACMSLAIAVEATHE